MDFNAIVTTAAPIDSHANFVSPGGAPSGSAPTSGNVIFRMRSQCQTTRAAGGRRRAGAPVTGT